MSSCRSPRKETPRLIAQGAIAVFLVSALVACGDPGHQSPAIAVTFDLQNYPIPAQIDTGAYVAVAATVTNDTNNRGVTFSCAPAGTCGGFYPSPASGSDVPLCYLAPNAVPSQNPVTITATSVTDPTKSASTTITIVNGPTNPCP
jgi:hypothetical protein